MFKEPYYCTTLLLLMYEVFLIWSINLNVGRITRTDTDPKLSNNYPKGRHTEADKLKADQGVPVPGGVHAVRDEPATCYFRDRSAVNTGHCCEFFVFINESLTTTVCSQLTNPAFRWSEQLPSPHSSSNSWSPSLGWKYYEVEDVRYLSSSPGDYHWWLMMAR